MFFSGRKSGVPAFANAHPPRTSGSAVGRFAGLPYRRIICIVFLSFSFFLFAEETDLGHLVTWIDAPKVEDKITLTSEEIEKLHAKDLPALLQNLGIQIKSYGAYGNEASPSVRGFTGSTIKVIIDGIPANSAQNGVFDFSSLPPESIEKIEIIKNGFNQDVTSEGGSGGTIFITTKKQIPGHHFSTSLNTKTYFNLPFDSFSGNIKYSSFLFGNTYLNTSLSGTLAQNKFPFINFNNEIENRKNNIVKDGNANISVTTYTKSGNSINLKDTFYIGNKEIPGPETSKNPGKQKDTENLLQAGFTMPAIQNKFRLNTNLSWQHIKQSYTSSSEDSLHKLNTLTFSGSGNYYGSDFWEQSVGTVMHYDFLDSTDTGTKKIFSGFIKETSILTPADFLTFTIPLSVNFSKNRFVFVPSFGSRFDFTYISLFTNASRLFLFPNLNQLYWKNSGTEAGNPDLKPEDGISFELGVEGKNIPVPFSLTVFSNYYKNKIQWISSGGKWTPENTASAFYLGTDFSFEANPLWFLSIKGNYEYLFNALLQEGITQYKRIMYTPEHVANLSLLFDFDTIFFETSGHFVSKRYISNLNISYLEPYFLWNAVLEYKPVSYLNFYVKGENLLNQHYEETENYPMPGISLEIGFKLEL